MQICPVCRAPIATTAHIGYECVIGRTQESSGTTTTTEETTFGTLTRNEF
eukprot:COSAG02_NODE_1783_length_10942_cov_1025.230266_1_plen_49_part_10